MEKEWTSIRVRVATLERLREFGRRTLKSVESGRVEGEAHPQGFLGHDVALNVLLDRDEQHRDRSRKSRKTA